MLKHVETEDGVYHTLLPGNKGFYKTMCGIKLVYDTFKFSNANGAKTICEQCNLIERNHNDYEVLSTDMVEKTQTIKVKKGVLNIAKAILAKQDDFHLCIKAGICPLCGRYLTVKWPDSYYCLMHGKMEVKNNGKVYQIGNEEIPA
jgi:hypothetical protein